MVSIMWNIEKLNKRSGERQNLQAGYKSRDTKARQTFSNLPKVLQKTISSSDHSYHVQGFKEFLIYCGYILKRIHKENLLKSRGKVSSMMEDNELKV